jgi:hypothetical protein
VKFLAVEQKAINVTQAAVVKAAHANPAPLGLMGFGMTTVLLCLKIAGLIPAESLGMVFAMGIFYGGIAQVIAGWLEYKNNNTFAATAFTSFGLFWITFIVISLLPMLGLAGAVDGVSMAAYVGIWGVFTTYMFIGTLTKPRTFQFVFGSAMLLFFIIAIADYTGNSLVRTIGGYEGIICGASAIYLACAEILNEAYGRKVLPI